MSAIKYPAGSGVTALPAPQAKPKEKRPRRKTEAGGNSQYAVSQPPKTSPLRAFSAIASANGWMTDYIKMPCDCEDWTDRRANCVIWWHDVPPVLHYRCECQVRQMSEQEMMEVIA